MIIVTSESITSALEAIANGGTPDISPARLAEYLLRNGFPKPPKEVRRRFATNLRTYPPVAVSVTKSNTLTDFVTFATGLFTLCDPREVAAESVGA